MKEFLCFLCLVISLVSLRSQNVRIYGNIIDESQYSSVILAPAVSSKLLDHKLETNPKNGYFEFNIYVAAPSFYKLYYKSKKIQLYVKPGAMIQMTIEVAKELNYVQFYEQMVQENAIFNQEQITYLGDRMDREVFKTAAVESQSAFFKEVDNAYFLKQKEWEKWIDDAHLDPDFVSLYSKNYMEMAAYLYKYFYPKFLGLSQDSFVVSNDNYLNLYQDLPEDKDYYGCPLYFENVMNIVKGRVNLANKEKILSNNVDDLELYKGYIREAELLKDEYVRAIIIENLIGEWVTQFGRTTDLKIEIASYIDQVNNSDRKNSLKKRLVSMAQYESGQPAPNFSFEDYSGNKRQSREFIGKILYIHVWSSKNAASMNEWIHAKNVFLKYKDRQDLIFLFLSIDDEKDAWEKTIRQHKLYEDIQAISFPNGYNSDFARKFAIQAVPSYILIDKSGNIISNRVPKPSQPEKLIPLLDKLLGN